MQYVSFISRIKRNITDFNFSNHFVRESKGNAFAYLLKGFLIFTIILVLLFELQVMDVINPPEKFDDSFVSSIIAVFDDPITIVWYLASMHTFVFLGLMLLNLVAWIIALIMRRKLSTNISNAECYKVAVYSMTVPNILLTIRYLFGIPIPLFNLLYLGLTVFYTHKFILYYIADEYDSYDMSEFLKKRNSEAES